MVYAAIDRSQVVFATLGILCAVNPCLFSGYLIGILQGPLYLQFWSSQSRMIRCSRANIFRVLGLCGEVVLIFFG